MNKFKNYNDSILKVSLDVGFSSQEYFCEIFTKIMGASPLKYRNFTKFSNNLSILDSNTIKKHVVNLNYFFNTVDKYKKNVPPKTTVKMLSIFK